MRRGHTLPSASVALGALAVSLAVSSGFVAAAEPPPDLVVVAHAGVPVAGLSEAQLNALFAGTRKHWADGSPVRVFNLTLGSPPRVEFDRVVLKMTPEGVSKYWLDRRIRGEGTPPRQMPTPELACRIVAVIPGSISYVPANKACKGLRIVARITRGKVVAP